MQEKTKREKAAIEETQGEGGLADEQLEDAAGGNAGAQPTRDAVRPREGANIFEDGFESGDTSR